MVRLIADLLFVQCFDRAFLKLFSANMQRFNTCSPSDTQGESFGVKLHLCSIVVVAPRLWMACQSPSLCFLLRLSCNLVAKMVKSFITTGVIFDFLSHCARGGTMKSSHELAKRDSLQRCQVLSLLSQSIHVHTLELAN